MLDRYGYRPKKRFGQNFLTDAATAARIAESIDEGSPEGQPSFRVLEIGPGTGELTHALLHRYDDVTAIDIDPDMIRILREHEGVSAAHIRQGDALAFDYEAFAAGKPWRVAGNLPYNIATPLIMQLVEMRDGPGTIVVTIQKDVADRLAAGPGTRAYGSLSIAVQYAMRVERLFTLGPGTFYPRPKVDSTVIRLRRRDRPAVAVRDAARFKQVVRAAFAYRRKTLANSLSLALSLERSAVAQALQRLGLDTEIRGEQLGLADFAGIADELST